MSLDRKSLNDILRVMKGKIIATIISFIVLIGIIGASILELRKSKGTTEWQTYTNQEYGYAIDYPANWYLREEKNVFDWHFEKNGKSSDYFIKKEEHILFIESSEKPLYWSSGLVGENSDEVTEQGYSISIVSYKNTENFSLKEYIKATFGRYGEFEIKDVFINQLKAIEAHEKDAFITYLPHYFLTYNNYIYEIRCRDENSGLEEIAEQIVQSFRFE